MTLLLPVLLLSDGTGLLGIVITSSLLRFLVQQLEKKQIFLLSHHEDN